MGSLTFLSPPWKLSAGFERLQVGLEPGFGITTPALKSVNYVCQKKSWILSLACGVLKKKIPWLLVPVMEQLNS